MWISRKKYKKMEADIDWLQAQVDALYMRVREHDLQIKKNTADIQNNKHYISTPTIERGDTNVDQQEEV